jgi:hypothetical protein
MGMSDAAALRFAAVLNDKSISGAGDEPRIAVLKARAAAFASAAPKT